MQVSLLGYQGSSVGGRPFPAALALRVQGLYLMPVPFLLRPGLPPVTLLQAQGPTWLQFPLSIWGGLRGSESAANVLKASRQAWPLDPV